ncbi:MAG: ammonia-forming cytochrome c nitrite reductase subunit c552 [bacterium]|jgi:nitrite reductase (cytochrome c-552)
MTARAIAVLVVALTPLERPAAPTAPDTAPQPAKASVRGLDPKSWQREFPVQYDQWRTPSRIEPQWKEQRGHAFSLKDRDEAGPEGDPRWAILRAGRPKLRPLPGACLECHASETPAGGNYWEARERAKTPVACIRCHETWGTGLSRREASVDPPARPAHAACAECHTEYHIKDGRVVRPGAALLSAVAAGGGSGPPETRVPDARAIEQYYDRIRLTDWTHPATGAGLIEPRHPQAQMFAAGPHAANRAGCPDCHMPKDARGVSDHRVVNPLERIEAACMRCHRLEAAELRARVNAIQERTRAAKSRALDAVADLIAAIRDAAASGAPASRLAEARAYHRRAQWRLEFVEADRSDGFHAPDEAASLLIEAIDLARRGQLAAGAGVRAAR